MGTFKKFQEFVSSKPKIELIADYPGKPAKTPPQGKGAKPYKQGQDDNRMTMKGEKDQEPLTQKGDKKNVYEPKDMKIDPVDGKTLQSWPKAKDAPRKKTKTEAFIDQTCKMSIAEFNEFMRKRLHTEKYVPPVTAHARGKIYPDPIETTRYVIALAKANRAAMENLAHEIRRQDATKRVLENLLDLPETYQHLTEVLSDPTRGSGRLRALSKKLMEIVGNPIGFEKPKSKVSMVPSDDNGMGDEEQDDDQDLDQDGPDDEMGDEDSEDLGQGDMDDAEGSEMGDDEDQMSHMGGEGDEEEPQFGDEDEESEDEFDDDEDDEDEDEDEEEGDEPQPQLGKPQLGRFPPRLG